jgi:hypothetical protein
MEEVVANDLHILNHNNINQGVLYHDESATGIGPTYPAKVELALPTDQPELLIGSIMHYKHNDYFYQANGKPNKYIKLTKSDFNNQYLNKKSHLKPVDVLDKLGIRWTKVNKAGYIVVYCPFHKDGQERNPSLNMHSTNGHYRCHSCRAAGDLINFYQKVTGIGFVQAAKDLGAWEGA